MNPSRSAASVDLQKARLLPAGDIFPFILLASCFAWWGIANNMTDPLVRAFTGIFDNLSNFQSSLIQFAFYGAYFGLAILGGALLTPLQGLIIDHSNVRISYIVPLICFIVITAYAIFAGKVNIPTRATITATE